MYKRQRLDIPRYTARGDTITHARPLLSRARYALSQSRSLSQTRPRMRMRIKIMGGGKECTTAKFQRPQKVYREETSPIQLALPDTALSADKQPESAVTLLTRVSSRLSSDPTCQARVKRYMVILLVRIYMYVRLCVQSNKSALASYPVRILRSILSEYRASMRACM